MQRTRALVPFTLSLALCLAGVGFHSAAPAAAKKNPAEAAETETEDPGKLSAGTFAGLGLRPLGPAIASGRIIDLAVHPERKKEYYVAVASGGVWKTENSGTTWTPLFDSEGSYSVGCITLDPNDPKVVWVGTGENNSQRSVGYGDGVYKSVDGGKSWKNVGLPESEHIGMIVVDPRDSDTVYVAAQGPLWRSGGDRGLYKTTDGGETWERILHVSDDTGVSEVLMDPRDPDVLYASAYQRRRRVWTLINGGPEAGLYKSTDAGVTWNQLQGGLPSGQVGRIGLALSPVDPDVLYAIVEALEDAQGVYRSTDGGGTWEKRSSYVSNSPQYYQELIPDPKNVDRVYSMDTWMMVTEDGGKSFQRVGQTYKHVDDHALWIDPEDTDYLLSGCDGGVYESFDRGATWAFKANLPITQFYKITVDDALPFYNVYGGTQDNNTLGGPARTPTNHGITNREWYVTVGGDGFQPAVDPTNPDIVYSQWQYGGLVRYDKSSGEIVDIKPQAAPGEDPLRWNWDSALLLSPHSPTRLYYATQRVFRSDDRGDSWTPVSDDLTRALDRNQLPVMGKVWSVDTVAKNRSTSPYGNIVAMSESPLVEGLLYAGTDDGIFQVREPGQEWRRLDVNELDAGPDLGYLGEVFASRHQADTVYMAVNQHKNADFKPYLLKSTDRGRTWTSLSEGLPERGSVYAIEQDTVDPQLLFAGTEFGVFFSPDDGGTWVELQGGGFPTIAVRDLAFQAREGDLVVGTFGRGFWVLDDVAPLRGVEEEALESETMLFPVRRAWMYMESSPLSLPGKSMQGDAFYTAPNPPFGAVFTYYLPESLETRKERRLAAEKETEEEGGTLAYPSWDELRLEDREADPAMVLTVTDEAGQVVRRLTGPVSAGFHRVAWDLRYPAANPVELTAAPRSVWDFVPQGPMAAPGSYRVSLARWQDGELTSVAEPQSFVAETTGTATLAAEDRDALVAFQQKVARLQRAVLGAVAAAGEARTRLDHIDKAILDTPDADAGLVDRSRALRERLADLGVLLQGDRTVARRSEPVAPSIM